MPDLFYQQKLAIASRCIGIHTVNQIRQSSSSDSSPHSTLPCRHPHQLYLARLLLPSPYGWSVWCCDTCISDQLRGISCKHLVHLVSLRRTNNMVDLRHSTFLLTISSVFIAPINEDITAPSLFELFAVVSSWWWTPSRHNPPARSKADDDMRLGKNLNRKIMGRFIMFPL